MEFFDRIPTKPNRIQIMPEDGTAAFYATIARADEPLREGTPLSAGNFNTMLAMIRSIDLTSSIEEVEDNG